MAWKNLKKKKAPGWDIPNEAWINGSEEIINKLVATIGKIWEGDEIPDGWKTGVIVTIHKNGDINDTNNYHLIRKTKLKKTLYALFIDLKKAFDTVNRKKLWEILERIGISKYLIEKLKGMYEETRARVRTEKGEKENWDRSGFEARMCAKSNSVLSIYK